MAGNMGPDLGSEGSKAVAVASGLGCAVVASLVVFIGIGVFIDQRFDRAPLFTLIGVAIGLIAAGYQLYELTLIGRKDRRNGPVGRTIERSVGSIGGRRDRS
ncbi:MAG: AtpZ/AtpI family protein [Chloroflexota bacterium]|nr:AtpZ/AtpI family protein [Chloroflexota bacterium]